MHLILSIIYLVCYVELLWTAGGHVNGGGIGMFLPFSGFMRDQSLASWGTKVFVLTGLVFYEIKLVLEMLYLICKK